MKERGMIIEKVFLAIYNKREREEGKRGEKKTGKKKEWELWGSFRDKGTGRDGEGSDGEVRKECVRGQEEERERKQERRN